MKNKSYEKNNKISSFFELFMDFDDFDRHFEISVLKHLDRVLSTQIRLK